MGYAILTAIVLISAFALIATGIKKNKPTENLKKPETKKPEIRKGETEKEKTRPAYRKKAVMTTPEQILFHRLKTALPKKTILAQVSMSALIDIDEPPGEWTYKNKINRKYIDFVICNDDTSICAAIELDDSSHQYGNRIKADAEKDAALKFAGIHMIRFDVKNMPDIAEIQRRIAAT